MIHVLSHCKAVSYRARVLSLPHSAPEMKTRAPSQENSLPGATLIFLSMLGPGSLLLQPRLLHRGLSGKVKAQSPGHRATTAIWPVWPLSAPAIVVGRKQAECSLVALKALPNNSGSQR